MEEEDADNMDLEMIAEHSSHSKGVSREEGDRTRRPSGRTSVMSGGGKGIAEWVSSTLVPEAVIDSLGGLDGYVIEEVKKEVLSTGNRATGSNGNDDNFLVKQVLKSVDDPNCSRVRCFLVKKYVKKMTQADRSAPKIMTTSSPVMVKLHKSNEEDGDVTRQSVTKGENQGKLQNLPELKPVDGQRLDFGRGTNPIHAKVDHVHDGNLVQQNTNLAASLRTYGSRGKTISPGCVQVIDVPNIANSLLHNVINIKGTSSMPVSVNQYAKTLPLITGGNTFNVVTSIEDNHKTPSVASVNGSSPATIVVSSNGTVPGPILRTPSTMPPGIGSNRSVGVPVIGGNTGPLSLVDTCDGFSAVTPTVVNTGVVIPNENSTAAATTLKSYNLASSEGKTILDSSILRTSGGLPVIYRTKNGVTFLVLNDGDNDKCEKPGSDVEDSSCCETEIITADLHSDDSNDFPCSSGAFSGRGDESILRDVPVGVTIPKIKTEPPDNDISNDDSQRVSGTGSSSGHKAQFVVKKEPDESREFVKVSGAVDDMIPSASGSATATDNDDEVMIVETEVVPPEVITIVEASSDDDEGFDPLQVTGTESSQDHKACAKVSIAIKSEPADENLQEREECVIVKREHGDSEDDRLVVKPDPDSTPADADVDTISIKTEPPDECSPLSVTVKSELCQDDNAEPEKCIQPVDLPMKLLEIKTEVSHEGTGEEASVPVSTHANTNDDEGMVSSKVKSEPCGDNSDLSTPATTKPQGGIAGDSEPSEDSAKPLSIKIEPTDLKRRHPSVLGETASNDTSVPPATDSNVLSQLPNSIQFVTLPGCYGQPQVAASSQSVSAANLCKTIPAKRILAAIAAQRSRSTASIKAVPSGNHIKIVAVNPSQVLYPNLLPQHKAASTSSSQPLLVAVNPNIAACIGNRAPLHRKQTLNVNVSAISDARVNGGLLNHRNQTQGGCVLKLSGDAGLPSKNCPPNYVKIVDPGLRPCRDIDDSAGSQFTTNQPLQIQLSGLNTTPPQQNCTASSSSPPLVNCTLSIEVEKASEGAPAASQNSSKSYKIKIFKVMQKSPAASVSTGVPLPCRVSSVKSLSTDEWVRIGTSKKQTESPTTSDTAVVKNGSNPPDANVGLKTNLIEPIPVSTSVTSVPTTSRAITSQLQHGLVAQHRATSQMSKHESPPPTVNNFTPPQPRSPLHQPPSAVSPVQPRFIVPTMMSVVHMVAPVPVVSEMPRRTEGVLHFTPVRPKEPEVPKEPKTKSTLTSSPSNAAESSKSVVVDCNSMQARGLGKKENTDEPANVITPSEDDDAKEKDGKKDVRAFVEAPSSRFQSCPHCNFETVSEALLFRHLKKFHADKEKATHKCDCCERSFKTVASLLSHLKSRTSGSKDDEFLCSICGSACETEDALIVHRKEHLVKRDFTCAVCLIKFTSWKALRKHRRKPCAPRKTQLAQQAKDTGGGEKKRQPQQRQRRTRGKKRCGDVDPKAGTTEHGGGDSDTNRGGRETMDADETSSAESDDTECNWSSALPDEIAENECIIARKRKASSDDFGDLMIDLKEEPETKACKIEAEFSLVQVLHP